jgi:hypothetical protein
MSSQPHLAEDIFQPGTDLQAALVHFHVGPNNSATGRRPPISQVDAPRRLSGPPGFRPRRARDRQRRFKS